jgi:hypothetical protein
MKTLIAVMALAMITTSVFAADGVVITPVEALGYGEALTGLSFSRGQTYHLVVYLRNKGITIEPNKKVFTGVFIGFGVINRPASRIYYEPNDPVYAVFKGKNSTLLYRGNRDWLIVQN